VGARYHRDVIEIGRDRFESLVAEAMDGIPEPFASALDEVAVVVEDHAAPPGPPLYGLYVGVPLPEGGLPSGVLPPRIAIYVHPLVDHCRSEEELVEQVRITVLHELGHHLGLDEDRLGDLGYA
jgi:predicted Zn-dependent protease with MMP-like domain